MGLWVEPQSRNSSHHYVTDYVINLISNIMKAQRPIKVDGTLKKKRKLFVSKENDTSNDGLEPC